SATGHFIYLVSAKHVLQDKTGTFFKNIFVRFNNKDGSIEQFPINLAVSGAKKNVFVHSDVTIDLAIIPVKMSENIDFKTIPIDQIIKRSEYEKENINVGTEVFFTGLFTPYIGTKTINPIFRFGRLCLIPNEKIKFVEIKRDILLIESSTFGGNSGSPVIFSYQNENQQRVRLAGVVLGSYNRGQFIENNTLKSNMLISSLGISAITPSEFIAEIINSLELMSLRKE
ncbi:trypsin-like peptidase domain-containing protein, partial [Flavobacteriaceae bacterium AH-315-B10]|nr:trypsin-like peptidase domain-containing protein [Flavobacteriaceae bacterium AH-315-B10]